MKHIKFEQYQNCFDGEENENVCDNYILKSSNREMYLQKIGKTTLSIFDDKMNCLDNNESLPWNYFSWWACLYMCFYMSICWIIISLR